MIIPIFIHPPDCDCDWCSMSFDDMQQIRLVIGVLSLMVAVGLLLFAKFH